MGTGSEDRGTIKTKGGKFRTPRLSEAEKRNRALSRALTPRKSTIIKSSSTGEVPF